MATNDVLAAGAVVFRPGKQVLLVHRPRYDDWSFPKGKLDRGEHQSAAAVREVEEETGLHVRLGPPLTRQRYRTGSRMKTVHYWTARSVGSDDISGYRPNTEIDRLVWLPVDEALKRLSYPRDRDLLKEARARRRKTTTIVVLRHAKARSRKAWRQEDQLRPLLQIGRHQAQRLVPLLAAYGVNRVISSSSARCVETVGPYADTTGWTLEVEDGLSEEKANRKELATLVADLVDGDGSAVVCTHRPVLPGVFQLLGVDDPGLEPGAFLVAHLRLG